MTNRIARSKGKLGKHNRGFQEEQVSEAGSQADLPHAGPEIGLLNFHGSHWLRRGVALDTRYQIERVK